MPKFAVAEKEGQGGGPGWGCSCRAFRLGEPTPEEAVKALARSASVTVTDKGGWYECWTDPEDRYRVTHDPANPGGWCKHCIAAMVAFAPWHRQLALGTQELLDEIHELRKENRKRGRRIKTLERK